MLFSGEGEGGGSQRVDGRSFSQRRIIPTPNAQIISLKTEIWPKVLLVDISFDGGF